MTPSFPWQAVDPPIPAHPGRVEAVHVTMAPTTVAR